MTVVARTPELERAARVFLLSPTGTLEERAAKKRLESLTPEGTTWAAIEVGMLLWILEQDELEALDGSRLRSDAWQTPELKTHVRGLRKEASGRL